MLPRHVISEHHVESIDNHKQAAIIGIDALRELFVLSMQSFRAHFIAPFAWTLAWTDGRSEFEIESKRPIELVYDSIHILTVRYAELVRVVEGQLHLSHSTAHSTLRELQKWTPRGSEFAVSAINLAVEASDRSTEAIADAGIAVAQAVDEESALVKSPSPATQRRNPTAE